MKFGNLIAKKYDYLNETEINQIRNMFPKEFEITEIKTENFLYGAYFYFKFKPSKIEKRIFNKSLVRFIIDKDGYAKGWLNIHKEVEGILEDKEKLVGDAWNGVQYVKSGIHFGCEQKDYRHKLWYIARENTLFKDVLNYTYDTELNNLGIKESLTNFAKEFIKE